MRLKQAAFRGALNELKLAGISATCTLLRLDGILQTKNANANFDEEVQALSDATQAGPWRELPMFSCFASHAPWSQGKRDLILAPQ
jgi:hypothetical protein